MFSLLAATYLSGFLSHSLSVRLIPRWGLGRCTGFWCFYTPSWISIAVTIRSLDPTLGLLEAGAQGISIAVIIHSFDRTLQTVLFKQALSKCGETAFSSKLGFCNCPVHDNYSSKPLARSPQDLTDANVNPCAQPMVNHPMINRSSQRTLVVI